MDYAAALKTIAGIIGIASPAAGTVLDTINGLIALATAASATIDDAKRAYDMIEGHIDGSTAIEEIEAEIEALEARGLVPIAPPDQA